MAWSEVTIQLKSGSATGMMNTGEVTVFNVPVKTKVKAGDKISCDGKDYEVTEVENSRDEFLAIYVGSNEPVEETKEEEQTEES